MVVVFNSMTTLRFVNQLNQSTVSAARTQCMWQPPAQ